VLREILALVDEKPAHAKAMADATGKIRDARPASEVAVLAKTDLVFRSWLRSVNGERNILSLFRNGNDAAAQKILNDFAVAKEARYKQLMQIV
jgi:hypothetical protein